MQFGPRCSAEGLGDSLNPTSVMAVVSSLFM